MSNPHRDYAPFELPENMEEDLGLFDAAVQPRCKDLSVESIDRMLLLVDGEPHSTVARQIASDVAGDFSAVIDEHHCSEHGDLDMDKLKGYGLVIAPRTKAQTDSSESTALDECLKSIFEMSRVPVLCVNGSALVDGPTEYWGHALAAVSQNYHSDWLALSWAFRLAKGKVTILEWVDPQARGAGALDSVDEAAINRLVNARLGPLVGAAQRFARSHGGKVHVESRLGNPVEEILSSAKSNDASIVVLSRGESPDEAHRAVARSLLTETQSQPKPPLLLIV